MRGEDGGNLGGGFLLWERSRVQNSCHSADAGVQMGQLSGHSEGLTAGRTGELGVAVAGTASVVPLVDSCAGFPSFLGR